MRKYYNKKEYEAVTDPGQKAGLETLLIQGKIKLVESPENIIEFSGIKTDLIYNYDSMSEDTKEKIAAQLYVEPDIEGVLEFTAEFSKKEYRIDEELKIKSRKELLEALEKVKIQKK